MGFVKNIKDKLSEHFVANEYDEEYDSAISDDDYEDDDRDYEENGSIYDGEDNTSDDYSYTPQGAMNAPEYNFGAPKAEFKKAPVKEAPKANANIYNMNTVRPVNKFKLNSILLRDIYDAKNVAALMMEKDTIVVVNLSLLTEEQKVRAMDFLDGAKFVTKSVFARFAENICAFVPESVELFGDFFSQIDLESFK
ncbi:MAG: cell division protein SepF [Acutalibacteraceae bacterium]|nr:cell division protein SepF [Acutalibacteraceae bacterium]